MPVFYEEMENSPSITMDRRGGSARRVVKIAWDDIDAFFTELFPLPFSGYADASFPGYPWLVVDTVQVEPFSSDPRGLNEDINYFPSGAKVTVSYKPPERDAGMQGTDHSGPGGSPGSTGGQQGSDQSFVTHKVSVGGEFITWPAQNLCWQRSKDGQPGWRGIANHKATGDTTAGIIVPQIEHTITWAQVYWPPWAAIRQCLGKINAYDFAGAPLGTLLFLGIEASHELTNAGLKAWSLEYKFTEKNNNALDPFKPQGWNWFLRPDGANAGTFQVLYRMVPEIPIGNDKFAYPATTLATALSTTSLLMTVANTSMFPATGNFRVAVDPGTLSEEEMGATLLGGGSFGLVRGLSGGRIRTHAVGAKVVQFPGRIYDYADFRYLFTPSMPLI
jgi:hypothetical protein